jgi:hypothetical protein
MEALKDRARATVVAGIAGAACWLRWVGDSGVSGLLLAFFVIENWAHPT